MTVETCETLTPMNDHYQLCPDGVDGPTPRSYWVVEGRLAAGAYPSDKGYTGSGPIPEPLEQLLDAGIGVFINLTQDHPGGTDQHLTRYDSGVEGRGEIVRYPIVDEALPEGGAGEMAVILNRIDAALDDGQNVYVHCWGGSGRTGAVVGCWLRRHGRFAADEVLEGLQALREAGDREGGWKPTPNTPDQAEFIVGWSEPTGPDKATLDRVVGAVLGSAAGDALGAGYEFTNPGPDREIAMEGGGAFGWAPGEWTDDTQMAVAILDVIATGSSDLDAIASNFLAWYQAGPVDVGNQTSSVLGSAAIPQDLAVVAVAFMDANPEAAGNGALMRTAPVALAALDDRTEIAGLAGSIASLPHAHPDSVAACVLWSLAIQQAITTAEPDQVFDWEAAVRNGLGHIVEDRRQRWDGLITEAVTGPPGMFNPNGYVVTAFQAALSAIINTPVPAEQPSDHLRDALVAAVRIGHDTDTVAAIAGALLGARWGAGAIPDEWNTLIHGERRRDSEPVTGTELEQLARRAVGA